MSKDIQPNVMKELYEQYLGSKNSDLESRITVMNDIIRQHPKLMDYIQTKIDSCYGTHKVYLVHMKVNGVGMIKIGYSPSFATGVVASAGTMGIMIPPSVSSRIMLLIGAMAL